MNSGPFKKELPLWFHAAVICPSILLLLLMSPVYYFRPDGWAAVTMFPSWVWAAAGLLFAWFGWERRTKRAAGLAFILWVAFLLCFAEEARSVVRVHRWPSAEWEVARKEGKALRVISLNASLGNPDAAAEVASFDPDIVLFQESPNPKEVEKLAHRLYGESGAAATDFDTSIIARGPLTSPPRQWSLAGMMIEARIRLGNGIELNAISVHLEPPRARLDLWSPSEWADARLERQRRREQLSRIVAKASTWSGNLPLIIGGDFNAPAGDAIFRLLSPHLHDAFREGGRGWGNTVLNDYPVHRFDQIWVSRHFRALAVRAVKTVHSDHRLVISDLLFTGHP
ncbi:MAG: endonuclease/exonuclease/phosphatase family protein [bacterium]